MPSIGLIGGDELKQLVKISTGRHEQPDPEYINISVSMDEFSGTPPQEISFFDSIIAIIRSDLAEKCGSQDARSARTGADISGLLRGFCSLRLHVGINVLRLKEGMKDFDLSRVELKNIYTSFDARQGFSLAPDEFVLCKTVEKISLPSNVAAFVQSRTSTALFGVDVTPTNQIIPGLQGAALFLEIRNLTDRTIFVPPYWPLAEIFFSRGTSEFSGEAPIFNEQNRDFIQTLEGQATSEQSFAERVFWPFLETIWEPLVAALIFVACGFLIDLCRRHLPAAFNEVGIGGCVVLAFLLYRWMAKQGLVKLQKLLRRRT